MTRTFNPRDVGRVIQLQAHGTSLDLESTVLGRGAPASRAVASWLRWPGADVLTLLPDAAVGGIPDGFLQARRRGRAPEVDVTFVAPGLNVGHGAAHTWQRLLGDACVALGQAGVARMFAACADGDGLVGQVLQQSGFTLFDVETVYERPAPFAAEVRSAGAGPNGTLSGGSAPLILRPFASAHRPALLSMLTVAQPDTCRAHESPWWRFACVPAPASRRRERWRVVEDGRGQMVGALRLVVGRSAVWLNVAGAAAASAANVDADALFALALAEASRIRPGGAVWTAVRDGDRALAAAARAAGFVSVARRQRSVRQTGLQRIAPVWRDAKRAVPQASSSPVTHARPRATRARERAHSLPGEGT